MNGIHNANDGLQVATRRRFLKEGACAVASVLAAGAAVAWAGAMPRSVRKERRPRLPRPPFRNARDAWEKGHNLRLAGCDRRSDLVWYTSGRIGGLTTAEFEQLFRYERDLAAAWHCGMLLQIKHPGHPDDLGYSVAFGDGWSGVAYCAERFGDTAGGAA